MFWLVLLVINTTCNATIKAYTETFLQDNHRKKNPSLWLAGNKRRANQMARILILTLSHWKSSAWAFKLCFIIYSFDFRCSACDVALSSWYFEKDGLLFCKDDYCAKYGESCQQCAQVHYYIINIPIEMKRKNNMPFLLFCFQTLLN